MKDKLWSTRYQQLIDYKGKFGTCKVPSGWKENPSLAKWVSRQRENEGSMPSERKALLDDIGFLWRKDMQKMKHAKWAKFYGELKAYYQEHGPTKITETNEQYRSLALWESRQRKREDKLSAERKALLNDIGFLWERDLAKKRKESWLSKYERLKKYYEEHGHSNVPFHNDKDKELEKLGGFVSRLRKNEQRLEPWQKRLLKKVDFVGSPGIEKRNRKRWLIMFNKMKRFKKEYGHCNVPSKFDENPKLGRWVEVQRLTFTRLPSWKRDKLLRAGFNTSAMLKRDEWKVWHAIYQRLVAFYKKYGHSEVPENWPEDPELARFVVNQRWAKNPPKEKTTLLKKVDFLSKGEISVSSKKRDNKGRFVNKLD